MAIVFGLIVGALLSALFMALIGLLGIRGVVVGCGVVWCILLLGIMR